MDLPTAAQIKKLASACRKVGITYFKCSNFEFSLGESPVFKAVSPMISAPAKKSIFSEPEGEDSWDSLSEEEKLFYSIGGIPAEGSKG